ncbi:MAG: N-acetylmuramoyl-L-alanine amidase [Clostridioides sp.]|jgi:N-acetylmuramoyl-L-alanine amidase|nr:N-acetylmuramoyl-L-alanine amidase [Clostridioides sp.]
MKKSNAFVFGIIAAIIIVLSFLSARGSYRNLPKEKPVSMTQGYNKGRVDDSIRNEESSNKNDIAKKTNEKKDNEGKTKIDVDKSQMQKNGQILVYIDPGHQAKGDPKLEPTAPGSGNQKARVSAGAVGISTRKPEYVLNLEAAEVLKNILIDKGFKVMMTRETHDVNISNAERARLGNEAKADIVVRVHGDSIADTSKTGASILVPSKISPYTKGIFEKSNYVAESVKKEMEGSGIKVNGIFERSDLTGFNWSTVPVFLVEMGFMSNYNEDQMLSNPDYQAKLMQAVANGIENSFK